MNVEGLILVAMGTFAFCGGALDWNFFLESRKAQFFVNIFGRNGARIFYALLGLSVIVAGILVMMNVIRNESGT
jgi:hypothetical protein